MRTIAFALTIALLLIGCDAAQHDGVSYMPKSGESSPPSGVPDTRDLNQEAGTDLGSPSSIPAKLGLPSSGPASDTSTTTRPDRQIIRTGEINLSVEHLDSAEHNLRRIVAANGGYTANSSRQRFDGSALTATVEVRIPSTKFDGLLASVRLFGELQSENISASDVSEEYIDLEARLKGQQELEARILKLLAERTGKLADIVAIEQKLAEVRTVIEGIQGRLRYLRARIDYSTLTVRMTEPGALTPSDTDTFGGRLERAFTQGIDGLTRLIAGFITLVIATLPLLVLAIVAWVLVRRMRARRASRVVNSTTVPPPTPPIAERPR